MSLSWIQAACAGLMGGVAATITQIVLWWAFTENLPDIFYRDARLTAAILMGPGVLPPPSTFDLKMMIVATIIHLALSVAYGLILAQAIHHLSLKPALFGGLVFGLILYVVNMYGVTHIFPWFAAARDWITILAHAVFGISAAAIYKVLPNKSVSVT